MSDRIGLARFGEHPLFFAVSLVRSMKPSLERGYDPTFSQAAFGPCAPGRRNPLGETVGMNYLTGFVADAHGLAKIQPTASLGVTFAILRIGVGSLWKTQSPASQSRTTAQSIGPSKRF